MIHQIGRKLRQQIHYFSGELCKDMGSIASRFVDEVIFGISCSGSVRLTEIGCALEEKIDLHATHKRLSRNLADESLEPSIGSRVLDLGSEHINENTLLIADPSDIQKNRYSKKYAQKMQYLARVRDGSEDTIGNGYWFCDIVSCEVGSNEITPLTQKLWPQDAPDFKSDNDQILSMVKRVRQITDGRGIIVYDRGGDRRSLLVPWTQDNTCRYLVRKRGDRHLLYKRKAKSDLELASLCKTHTRKR